MKQKRNVNRENIIVKGLNLGVVMVVAALSIGSIANAADTKLNIVFVFADNLGYGELGPYGGGILRGAPTPRIDQLASEGLRLTPCLVEPGCTPSRAALMTGRDSPRAGLSTIIIGGTSNPLSTIVRFGETRDRRVRASSLRAEVA